MSNSIVGRISNSLWDGLTVVFAAATLLQFRYASLGFETAVIIMFLLVVLGLWNVRTTIEDTEIYE